MSAIVARFEIPYTQLLNPLSELCGPLPAYAEDSAVLLDLYRNMVRARLFDKKAIALQRTGKMGTYAQLRLGMPCERMTSLCPTTVITQLNFNAA